ncbi:HDOD domain-containing protein [Ideonella sp. DXS22W]|uniref:HDOD domain-containing protein n=1 Tax=Pseudaquabacterium inlustre TaxID=2984192 RepID=A0ABU9CG65_9BURK
MNFIDDVLSGRIELPTVPRVVERLLTLMRRPDAALHELVSELEQDPVMSSRVLRLANSSYFGGRRTAASLGDAVGMVGSRTLQTLVVACGAQAAFAQVPAVNLRHFWLASTLTASLARMLARQTGVNADDAYGAGLLQGIGHLILCQCHPRQAIEGFPSVRPLWGEPLARLEHKLFGVSHPMVSAVWADKLGMPQPVVVAIAQSLQRNDGRVTDVRMIRTLQVAASMAAGAALGESLEQTLSGVNMELVDTLGLGAYLASPAAETDFGDLQASPALA